MSNQSHILPSKILPSEYYTTFTLKGNGRNRYTLFTSHDDRQSARKLFPQMSYAQHLELALKYKALQDAANVDYDNAVNVAFLEHFGRLPHPTDYKVSGIWSDELPRNHKDNIRSILNLSSQYHYAYYLHNAMLINADKVNKV